MVRRIWSAIQPALIQAHLATVASFPVVVRGADELRRLLLRHHRASR